MINQNVSRVLEKLGFYYIQQRANSISVGHEPGVMTDALLVDADGNIVGGRYADLVKKALTALELYDASADQYSYFSPSMRDQLFNDISAKSNLPLEIVQKLTR